MVLWWFFHESHLVFEYGFKQLRCECEKYPGIFRGILSLPHTDVMDLNNGMSPRS